MAKVERLEKEFSDLVDRAAKLVLCPNQRITPEDFRSRIKPSDLAGKEHYKKFFEKHFRIRGKTLHDLWDCLTDHWNFMNYFLLERVIRAYGEPDPELQNDMGAYIRKLQEFRKSTLIHKFVEYSPRLVDNVKVKLFCNFVVKKMKLNWEESTLEDIECVKKLITQKFLLPKWLMSLKKYQRGCVAITWLMSSVIASDVMVDIGNIDSEFFKEHHIEDITLDEKRVAYYKFTAFLKEMYIEMTQDEKNLSDFQLAQIEKKKKERRHMSKSKKSSIRGGIDEITFKNLPLLRKP